MQIKNYTKSLRSQRAEKTEYSNSFFVKTVFEWNHHEETVVRTPSVDSRSETALVHCQYIYGARLHKIENGNWECVKETRKTTK